MRAASVLPSYWTLPLQAMAELGEGGEGEGEGEEGGWALRSTAAMKEGWVQWFMGRMCLGWLYLNLRLEDHSASMGRSFASSFGRMGYSIVFARGLWTGLSVVWVFIVSGSAMFGFVLLLGNTVVGEVCSRGDPMARAELVRDRSAAIQRIKADTEAKDNPLKDGVDGTDARHVIGNGDGARQNPRRRGGTGRHKVASSSGSATQGGGPGT